MGTLAELRAKLLSQEPKTTKNTEPKDNTVFPHWNMTEGSSATTRFLPDADPKNTFFWVEKAMINLEFAGIKNQLDSKKVTVSVPCVEMWGEPCPILAEVRPWFKDPSLESLARSYWKKRSYIFQGFVRKNPLSEDKTPANPIRRFNISPQIFNLIKSTMLDPNLEKLPTDYTEGLDFSIFKTSKGGYADYSTSRWAWKPSALTMEEQDAIETHGLFNLADFLPKKPTAVELQIIKEMFEASVDGQPYDAAKWGAYYKPYGLQVATADYASTQIAVPNTVAKPVISEPVVEKVQPTVDMSPPWNDDELNEHVDEVNTATSTPVQTPSPTATGNPKADEILAMIRNRQKTV